MKILCIDDNKDIIELLEKILTSKGHEVIICDNGTEGLKLIKNSKSDMILLDMAMPKFSGEDVIESLSVEELEENNIVLFTASSITDSKIKQYLQMGIKDCIKKPVRVEKLVSTIKKFEK